MLTNQCRGVPPFKRTKQTEGPFFPTSRKNWESCARGQQPSHVKTNHVTETSTTNTKPNTGTTEDSSQETGNMTTSNESPAREVRSVKESLLRPKTFVKIGTWNVKTMWETSKTAQVIREMRKNKLDILGISECRWTGSGRHLTVDEEGNSFTIMYSGRENTHDSGVALIVSKEKAKTLIEWEPISDRLLKARFNSKFCKLSIIQCYAPTNDAEDEAKDNWYEQLQQAVASVPQHDMLVIMGDMNAKVGADNTGRERAMGKHGCGVINENGERLVDFCLNNNCVIGGTIFPHKTIHKLTWKSSDKKTVNQIDHVIVNNKWRKSMRDVRVFRGADVRSDHYLVSTQIKLKLRQAPLQNQRRQVLDIAKLNAPSMKKDFVLELRNRFNILNDLDEEDEPSVQKQWDTIKETYVEATKKVVGYRKKNNKVWISPGTWKKIEERRKLKERSLNTKSKRIQEQVEAEYKIKDKEVKKSARADKRTYIEEMAQEAEQAAIRGEMSTVYKITKQLCGSYANKSAPVKDKQGKSLTTEREQAARWVEHFKEVLNLPDPEEPANPLEAEIELNIDMQPPTEEEVRKAIKATKRGKSPGCDNIHAEMLKADINTATKLFTDLFHSIWDSETIPDDWNKGMIVKLPKKGDLRNCNNWRGITLLSVPGKIFCRILLNRIDDAINTKLRQEQAGFIKGKGCIDQIFALRNIIEQCLEWNAPLWINFIDFRKAFDSVHRSSLWKILRSYGLPQKIVDLIKLFYEKFECNIILDNTLSESFPVKSGVRQGCILSPILFVIVIDWIMRSTTADRPRGIQWTMFRHLEDLDFADDIALLSSTKQHSQEKSQLLNTYAKQTGLNINRKKTQVMCINAANTTPVTIEGEPLELVEDFTYLGSNISKEDGAKKDIEARLNKARGTFSRLRNVWKSKQYSLKTKIKLYNSNVKSVLLYSSECWRVTKKDMARVEAFHNGCLRRICKIFWPNKVSNKALYEKTGCQSLVLEIKKRRFRWLGHILRMPMEKIPKVALRWTPTGKRKRGRPKNTWRRTVVAELDEINLTWGQAELVARDRDRWRKVVDALCLSRDEEDK